MVQRSACTLETPSPRLYVVWIEWPIGAMPVLDSYYCRQNDSRSSIAQVNAVGLALNLYF